MPGNGVLGNHAQRCCESQNVRTGTAEARRKSEWRELEPHSLTYRLLESRFGTGYRHATGLSCDVGTFNRSRRTCSCDCVCCSSSLRCCGRVSPCVPPPLIRRPIDIGSRRELFADYFLIDTMRDVRLVLHTPRDEGVVVRFDQPWEGPFCGYCTVIHDGSTYRLYYRGLPTAGRDGSAAEVVLLRRVGGWRSLDETITGAVRGGWHQGEQRRVVQRRAGHAQLQPAAGHASGCAGRGAVQSAGGHDGKRSRGACVARRHPLETPGGSAGAHQGDGAVPLHVRLAESGVLVGDGIAVRVLLPRVPGRRAAHLSHDQLGFRALVCAGTDGVPAP